MLYAPSPVYAAATGRRSVCAVVPMPRNTVNNSPHWIFFPKPKNFIPKVTGIVFGGKI